LGGTAAAFTCAGALLVSYARRMAPGPLTRWAGRAAVLGYALPGTVLAVGVYLPGAWLDDVLHHAAGTLFGMDAPLVIQGTLGLMLAAYAIRFMAAGYGAVDSAMQRITPSMEEAARTLGASGAGLLRRVHLPLVRKGLLSGAVLVLVDVMKEMPITLMMRPFGWDTLAVKIYEFTTEGEWELAALPAAALVLAGAIPVMLLTRGMES
jgi:iron(III) transport system permease protein